MKNRKALLFGVFVAVLFESCSNGPANNSESTVFEYYLINGLGREVVSVMYVNVQSSFVIYGERIGAGDTTMILKDLTAPYTLPSDKFTIIRILERDSSTLITNITPDNNSEWKTIEDGSGGSKWYYALN